jgi:hypothetical protein
MNSTIIKTTVHVHCEHFSWERTQKFVVYAYKLEDTEHRTYIGPQEVEIEVPTDYDPRKKQIAALEAQKKHAMAEFHKSVSEINDRISKLTALEYTP